MYPKETLKKGSKIKNRRVRVHDIRQPKEKHCRWCGRETGTECFRHCEIPLLKMKYGKGMGVKIDDSLTVWGCYECDLKMSTKLNPLDEDYTFEKLIEWENKWMMGIIETHLV